MSVLLPEGLRDSRPACGKRATLALLAAAADHEYAPLKHLALPALGLGGLLQPYIERSHLVATSVLAVQGVVRLRSY